MTGISLGKGDNNKYSNPIMGGALAKSGSQVESRFRNKPF